MFRNYLATALRNLDRNKSYAGITIAGLALGFAAAILIALFVRDEFSYDRFIPGYRDVYRFGITINAPNTAPIDSDVVEVWTGPFLKLQFPQIEESARLVPAYFPPLVKRGDFHAAEQNFMWADPDFFKIMRLPALAGDLSTALQAPDGLVVTRAMARKYFGRDAPLGETLLVDGHPMTVTAVLKDLPSNTHLKGDFFGSGKGEYSAIKQSEAMNGPGDLFNNTLTYIRLKPGASVDEVRRGLPAFLAERLPLQPGLGRQGFTRSPNLVSLADIHLRPSTQGALKPAGDRAIIDAIALVGVLIVLIAAINFVTLMTARAGRRAVEVGVRKAAGATRGDLIVQFTGEALIYVGLAMLLAMALAELLLPAVNALLQRHIDFDYLHAPGFTAAIIGVAAVVGLLAGAYPAFVLSSFRPVMVLKGGLIGGGGSAFVRQALVIVQFAILIGLVVTTATITRQTFYALNEGLRVNKDQVLLAFSEPCTDQFKDEVSALPGVKVAACSSAQAIGLSNAVDTATVGDRHADLDTAGLDFGFFEVYSVRPLAGRLFQRDRPGDDYQTNPNSTQPVIINETAARALGFASASAAVGKTLSWRGPLIAARTDDPQRPSEIVGVVPDFNFGSVRTPIHGTIYYVGPKTSLLSNALNVKLNGSNVPETLKAIDRIWDRLGDGRPMIRVFVDLFMMRLYVDSIIQGGAIAVCAVIALFIGCLGLFALSAYTAEQRTKEIGIRKTMGASTGDVLRLLMWQFTQPVLWANLIAWPIAWLVMDRWLHGFAYHVDLAPWTFLAAAAGALLIAWLTVFFQAYKVARAKPVGALRYE